MEGTAVKKNYQVVSRHDRRAMGRWLANNGQGLLPLGGGSEGDTAELQSAREHV